jgi:hypothetical protein
MNMKISYDQHCRPPIHSTWAIRVRKWRRATGDFPRRRWRHCELPRAISFSCELRFGKHPGFRLRQTNSVRARSRGVRGPGIRDVLGDFNEAAGHRGQWRKGKDSFRPPKPTWTERSASHTDRVSASLILVSALSGEGDEQEEVFGTDDGHVSATYDQVERLGGIANVRVRFISDASTCSSQGTFYTLHDASLIPRVRDTVSTHRTRSVADESMTVD